MKITAKELARLLNARLEGDGGAMISGIGSPEDAGAEDLIYVEAEKHAARAQASAARCVVAAEGAPLKNKTVLIAAQPKLAFARAAARLVEEPPIASGVHPTTVVDASAKLSRGVSVGPYAVI